MAIREVIVNPTPEFLATHLLASLTTDAEGNVLAELAPYPATVEQLRALRQQMERQVRDLKEKVELLTRGVKPAYVQANVVLANERLHEENDTLRLKLCAARRLCEWYRAYWMYLTGRSANPGSFPFDAIKLEEDWTPWGYEEAQEKRNEDDRATDTTQWSHTHPTPLQSRITTIELNGV